MNEIRHNYPDSSRAEIAADGSTWELTLPNGQHLRGRAKDVRAAEANIMAARNIWILNAWNRGEYQSIPGKGQFFVCPLSST